MLSILKRLALPAALFAALPAFAHDGVHIADPFARIIQGNGAVYFRIDNHADADDRLIGAESPAHMTMLMSTVEDASGMSKMIDAPEGFAIAAGSSHVLAPAGDHVMLMHLMSEPADGDLITVVLIFEKAGRVSVTLPVMNTRRDPPGMEPTPYDTMSGEDD